MKIETTTDYSKFKSIGGNRNKNLMHINRLKKSMKQNYLFTIIIVNERFEIIDGQHRFEVIKELGLPLNYVVCTGYSLNEVHLLNQTAKVWNADDYLNGYCNLGYEDYKTYKDFKTRYNLGHNECMAILLCAKSKGGIDVFYAGNFKIKDYAKSCMIIEKICQIEPFYKGYKRRAFIFTMLTLLQNNNFDFNDFLQKLKQQPTALVDCTSVNNYLELIENIYNYRRREKVNLRF
jgi:hypothetical protein